MDYRLAIESTPDTVPGGTGILLLHPSTGETDRIDTDFLKTDTDHMLVISTRTTAREVRQKLEHYEVDEDKATILDTISVERGYTRRASENVQYVAAPDDLQGIVDRTEVFLESHEGKRRVSFDSLTEMIYYADADAAHEAVEAVLELLDEHDAVGLFHLAKGVHEDPLIEEFAALFDGVVELDEDGTVSSEF
jgi:KaiC/GvpD/RAD55 family RecA-like ATPase